MECVDFAFAARQANFRNVQLFSLKTQGVAKPPGRIAPCR